MPETSRGWRTRPPLWWRRYSCLQIGCQVRCDENTIRRRQAVGRGIRLMPVGIKQGRQAHLIELGALLAGEAEFSRLQIVGKLFLGTGTDHRRCDTRPA